MSKMMTITTLAVASIVVGATPAVADLPGAMGGKVAPALADTVLLADSRVRYDDGWMDFRNGRWVPRDGSSSNSNSNSSSNSNSNSSSNSSNNSSSNSSNNSSSNSSDDDND